MIQSFDIIIIGGGIAGLYAAYKILKIAPKTSLLILEKSNKHGIGGRANNEMFCGSSVAIGAGVGRKKKDILLIQLLKELRVEFHEFLSSAQYSLMVHPECNLKKNFLYLKLLYNKNPEKYSGKTFKQFAQPILGKELYQKFLICSGYSDYENEDINDTLYNYGFDDNYDDWIGLSISWKKLIQTMCKFIGDNKIKTSYNVTGIKLSDNPSGFVISSEKGKRLFCNKVIMATTISSVLNLVPGANERNSIYQQIHGQPFLRIYAKFSKKSIPMIQELVSKTTVVPGPLHKIIPINPENGIYMIVYTDNKDAELIKKYKKNTTENRTILEKLLEASLGAPQDSLEILSMVDFYWTEGTHFYEPLKKSFSSRKEFIRKAQHPIPGMLIVGEMIALHQGWVEGALESVEDVVTKKWIQK